jgi:hypothetical protein
MTTVSGTGNPIITFRVSWKLGAVEERIASSNGTVDAVYLTNIAIGHIETTADAGSITGRRTKVLGTKYVVFTQGSRWRVLAIKQNVAVVYGTSDAVIAGRIERGVTTPVIYVASTHRTKIVIVTKRIDYVVFTASEIGTSVVGTFDSVVTVERVRGCIKTAKTWMAGVR